MKRLVCIVALVIERLAFVVIFAGIVLLLNGCVAYAPPYTHPGAYYGVPYGGYGYDYPAYGYYGFSPHFYGGFSGGYGWRGHGRR